MYDPDAVQPMRDELVAVGFRELRTPEEVNEVVNTHDDKTTLVMINSVCGCAAGGARPGVSLALQNSIIPDRLTTVFAGMERDAVDQMRAHIKLPPSSPSMAIIKNGQVVYFMPRYEIEGYSPEQIAAKLVNKFNELCSAPGPSVPKEQYDQVIYAKSCGSKIPMYKGN